MCRGCDIDNLEEYLDWHHSYILALQHVKVSEQKLLELSNNVNDRTHSDMFREHHKRMVRIRREFGRLDQKLNTRSGGDD